MKRITIASVDSGALMPWICPNFLRRGVRIFEWPERMMHAKCGVIDGVWTTIGTYNLDRRSFLHNLEVGLVTIDRDLGDRMEVQFERDLVHTAAASNLTRRTRWKPQTRPDAVVIGRA